MNLEFHLMGRTDINSMKRYITNHTPDDKMNNENKKSIARGRTKQYKRKSSIEISFVTVDILAKSANISIY